MTEVQIEAIVKGALAQVEQHVEACVVFADHAVASALADILLNAPRWSHCVTDEFTLARALGAALRFPEFEVVVALEVGPATKHRIVRAMALAKEMSLANVSIFLTGDVDGIDGAQYFVLDHDPEVVVPQWHACPVHMQQYEITQQDCETPQSIVDRLDAWSEQDELLLCWDMHRYSDLALSLMVAAQFSAQGRQVWAQLQSSDLRNPELLEVAEAIGHARLPLKCFIAAPDLDALTLPWSYWSRLPSWWVHMPLDADEAVSWLQSSIDHLWPSLICLPPYWFKHLVPAEFGHARRVEHQFGQIDLICSPTLYNETMEARAALEKIDVHARVHLLSGLAPMAALDINDSELLLIIDKEIRAPLADILLPQLGELCQRIELCGPMQCGGERPGASDIVAQVRTLVTATSN